MADWAEPTITTQYDVFVAEAKDRDVDSATMFLNAPTNPPNGAIRWNRSTNVFESYSTGTSTWTPIISGIAGGGTGGTTAATARTALGLGTMATQNANAVAVTGGAVAGLTQLDMSAGITFVADASYDIATFAKQARKGYFKDALVIPVGSDKYATS